MVGLCIKRGLGQTITNLLNPDVVENWKLLGQEHDGSLLISWVSTSFGSNLKHTAVGIFYSDTNVLEVLCNFTKVVNLIQATTNVSKSVLVFVTKDIKQSDDSEDENILYILNAINVPVSNYDAQISNSNTIQSKYQIMAQFLCNRKQNGVDKFLVLIHHKSITLYQVDPVNIGENDLKKDIAYTSLEVVVKSFSWAEWDSVHQSLFYIHYRKNPVTVEGEENQGEDQSPTLSALQFHSDAPHETVLNIPLNLPPSLLESSCNTYEDEPVPLRVHDCSLSVTVLTDNRGVVCICHHYLYEPIKSPLITDDIDQHSTVHLAYSVTLLHHGVVLHCTVPGIPWCQARELKPIFALYKEDHMIVYSPGLFLHLLDIGPGHEPCCHIILPHSLLGPEQWTVLRNPLNGAEVINLVTLELAHFVIEPKTLIKAYQDLEGGIPNKLSILHYFLVHHQDFEIVSELLLSMAENCLNPEVIKIFHEVLVGGAFSSVLKSLSSDALPLLRFLPFTTVSGAAAIELKINGYMMTITQESLWNPAVMLLSPRQRVCSHRIDLWTKLWDLIAASADVVRFKPSTVVEKLMVSLVCYQLVIVSYSGEFLKILNETKKRVKLVWEYFDNKVQLIRLVGDGMPEALSRCSTPLSPGSFSGSTALADMSSIVNGRAKPQLPFYEIEKCTASKQEHIISVNLRELSMHLVKHERESPMQVHAVATRHAAAQLEMSRYLCGIITRSAAVSVHQAKGFQLVNELSSARRLVLFSLFEKFSLAVDALAYPLPQGFSSFFTYLAYCTLPFDTFVQYVQANALQLQIDVMKIIMNDLGNRSDGVKRKLRLLLLLPRSRAKRILNQWPHPASLMIRAREHSANILSGLETRTHLHRTKTHSNAGLSTFLSADRVSPLDTFLDLLTAKASLAELDFNLLVEATMSSTNQIFEERK